MYELLYPAVLGSVFVIFVSQDIVRMRIYPRFIFGIGFICHWSAIFIYNTTENKKSEYTPIAFVLNIALIISIYQAFASLPRFETVDPTYGIFYFWVLVIGLIYLTEDVLRGRFESSYEIQIYLSAVDSALVVLGGTLLLLREYVPAFRGSQVIVYGFIFCLAIVSAVTIRSY
jgi:hypothetical protein